MSLKGDCANALGAYILRHYLCLKEREVICPRVSLPILRVFFRNSLHGQCLVPVCQSKLGECIGRRLWYRFCFAERALVWGGFLSPLSLKSCGSTDVSSVFFNLNLFLLPVQPHRTRKHLQPGHHAHHRRGGGHLWYHLCQIQLARSQGEVPVPPCSTVDREPVLCCDPQVVQG